MSITQTDIDSLLSAADNLAAEAVAAPPSRPEPTPTHPWSGLAAPSRTPSALTPHAPAELRRILKMHVPVIVKLAESNLPVSAVLKITSGSILEFERPADAELELLVNNKVVGRGQAVKVGENFGLRVTRICGVQNTIRALGA